MLPRLWRGGPGTYYLALARGRVEGTRKSSRDRPCIADRNSDPTMPYPEKAGGIIRGVLTWASPHNESLALMASKSDKNRVGSMATG